MLLSYCNSGREKLNKSDYYETLCNNHNQVMFNLKQLKKNIKSEADRKLVNETLALVRYCKWQGQRMEARLSRYYNAIINMGFTRARKGPAKSWDEK